MEHSFDINIATRYGVQAAVLLNNIRFWIEKNKANNTNYFEGTYWTYNSKQAFSNLFPYMTARQIDYALKKLIDDGIIKTGNFNKVAYDRTLWYAITEKGYSILQNCNMEITKNENGTANIVEPIPNNKPINKTSNNNPDNNSVQKRFAPPTLEEVSQYCNERQNGIDPQRFIDYYTSNGWKVGRNPMKDWKAAVRTWESKENNTKPKIDVVPSTPQPNNFDENVETQNALINLCHTLLDREFNEEEINQIKKAVNNDPLSVLKDIAKDIVKEKPTTLSQVLKLYEEKSYDYYLNCFN